MSFGFFSALEIGGFRLGGELTLPAECFSFGVFRREKNPRKIDLISGHSRASPMRGKQNRAEIGVWVLSPSQRTFTAHLHLHPRTGEELKFPQVPHKETASTHSRRGRKQIYPPQCLGTQSKKFSPSEEL